jgi:restriction system protein
MMQKVGSVIDGKDLSLSKWPKLIFDPPLDTLVLDYQFPTDKHKEEYLAKISERSDLEIRSLLLKFLIPSGSLGCDEFHAAYLKEPPRGRNKHLFEYQRRLILWDAGLKDVFPWEGITWVLDACPWWPKEAIAALSAYVLTHIQFLPDGRINGLGDALEIIRARYIGTPTTNVDKVSSLLDLSSRQFECLVERTYNKLGYATTLTPRQKDGGRDILADHTVPSRRERLRIECKRYVTPVSVGPLRSLLGVVSSERANKGVLVTSSRFTRTGMRFAQENPRIELIDGPTLGL